jgi:alpha-L-arabinofuranosidase
MSIRIPRKSVLTIDASRRLFPVSRDLYGLFFEEISRAGDGGLYAELVQNRSFEDALVPERCTYKDGKLTTPAGWETKFPEPGSLPGWDVVQEGDAKIAVGLDAVEVLNPANPLSLRLEVASMNHGRAGIRNGGFWGIPVQAGGKYRLALYAKLKDKAPDTVLTVSLEGARGVYAAAPLTITAGGWKRYEAVLESGGPDTQASLVISVAAPGTLWIDFVSLLPGNTFKHEYACFRADLVELMAALKPRFLRFPGGCFVEGFTIETASRWKKTIGRDVERHGQWNLWSYRTTNGIGYHEYLQLCEDLGMEGMFVVNCGMSCQSRCGELVPLEQLDEWVQDALDAVEYAKGPASSTWGAVRAKNGHPAPFGLKYVEIGNENSGPEYTVRYKVFQEALKREWPDVILISNTHTEKEHLPTEIVDEHFYNDSYFFISNHDLYDGYDRKGPKVYVGEYANVVECGNGNLGAAISEAAFLTGLERNQDIVAMSSYAPLFANVNHRVWHPDLIYFDNHRAFGTPAYHLIRMFSENRGDVVLAASLETEQGLHFLRGCAGFESEADSVSFRSITVTSNGTTLFSSAGHNPLSPWREVSGKWGFEDGVLHVVEGGESNSVSFGEVSWGGYTLSCEARSSQGAPFRLRFLDNGRAGGERNCFVWEIGEGGESRIRHRAGGLREWVGPAAPYRVEPGQWNAFTVTITETTIQCRVNGILVNEAALKPMPAVCAVSTFDTATNEIIAKLVNVTDDVRETDIRIQGAGGIVPEASLAVLTSDSLWDENTFDQPVKVVPRTSVLLGVGRNFTYPVPPRSVVIMRIKGHVSSAGDRDAS